MSMILDAMKRSKQGEAQSSGIPTVDTVHYVAEPQPRFTRLQLVLLAGIGVTIVAVSAVAFWSFQEPLILKNQVLQTQDIEQAAASETDKRTGLSETQASGTHSSESQAPPPRGPAELVVPTASENAREANVSVNRAKGLTSEDRREGAEKAQRMTPPKPASSDELQAIYRALSEEVNQERGSAAPAPSNSTDMRTMSSGSQRAQAPAADNFSNATVEATDDTPAEDNKDETPPIDFADILAAAQEELGVKPLVESSEPLLETLSQQVKDDIPSLIYSEHDYTPSGSSSVTLNGKVLKERQRVGAFTVIEILPDSVVLRWRETQFRVRARNSWINM